MAVIGVPHPDFGEGVVAVAVTKPSAIVDSVDIRAAVPRHLAGLERPKAVIVVDEPPRNAMGKVQNVLLRTECSHLFAQS